MSRVGNVTNPHINPPLPQNVFWQVVGYKIWHIWPEMSDNLAAFEQSLIG